MARFARIALPRRPYLVAHSAQSGGEIFFSPSDKRAYLNVLAANSERFGMEVWAYCLTADQVHLLVYPRGAGSLAGAVGRTHVAHTRRVNIEKGLTGPFWAGRFHSTLLDTPHLWAAVHYVETLPVKEGLVRKAEKYTWSSARAHALGRKDPLLSPKRPFPDQKRVGNWAKWLASPPDEALEEAVRKNVRTGRPSVSRPMLERLEKNLGMPLIPRKRGPKPGKRKSLRP